MYPTAMFQSIAAPIYDGDPIVLYHPVTAQGKCNLCCSLSDENNFQHMSQNMLLLVSDTGLHLKCIYICRLICTNVFLLCQQQGLRSPSHNKHTLHPDFGFWYHSLIKENEEPSAKWLITGPGPRLYKHLVVPEVRQCSKTIQNNYAECQKITGANRKRSQWPMLKQYE